MTGYFTVAYQTRNILAGLDDGMSLDSPFLLTFFRIPANSLKDILEKRHCRGIHDIKPSYILIA